MENVIKKWVERAEYDLGTAKAMLRSDRYLYVTFMCQQAVEKLLKAIIIQHGGEALRTHNLVRLAQLAEVYGAMSESEQGFLADLTPFAIEARYGDYRKKLSEITDNKMAADYLEKTKRLFKWLQRRMEK